MNPTPEDDDSFDGPKTSFSVSEIIETNRLPIAGLLIGLALLGGAIFLYKNDYLMSGNKIEILDSNSLKVPVTTVTEKLIVLEAAGAVIKPGVYKLKENDRVEDLLIAAGGLSGDADRAWVEKYVNKAARVSDGQKIYIYKTGEFTSNSDKQSAERSAKNSGGDLGVKTGSSNVAGAATVGVNINSASLSELDSLPGIGQVYGQSIIDHRPYSDLDELVSKGAIKESVYEKIKSMISIF